MQISEHWEKILAGVVALPYILYKVYQTLKADSKGDDLDERVDAYSRKLEAALDKTNAKLDAVQKENVAIQIENATYKARITILEAESLRLRQMSAKTIENPKLIEGETINEG